MPTLLSLMAPRVVILTTYGNIRKKGSLVFNRETFRNILFMFPQHNSTHKELIGVIHSSSLRDAPMMTSARSILSSKQRPRRICAMRPLITSNQLTSRECLTHRMHGLSWSHFSRLDIMTLGQCFAHYWPFVWESIGHRWIILTKGQKMGSPDIVSVVRLLKLVHKRSICRWLEMPWRPCDASARFVDNCTQTQMCLCEWKCPDSEQHWNAFQDV